MAMRVKDLVLQVSQPPLSHAKMHCCHMQ